MNDEKFPGDLLEMGKAGRPHGIKGEIGVDWHGDFIPSPGAPIYFRQPGLQPKEYRVLACRRHKGRPLFLLDGLEDRTEAEKLTGAQVLMRRDSLPDLEEGEAYLRDIIGSRVFLPDGRFLGLLDHVEFPAGQEIWAIRDAGENEILFPARESFIKSLNPKNGEVVIDPPPGLLEIYRA